VIPESLVEPMANPEYARFSEESNALDYLEKTIEFIHRVDANPTDWKWVILSLHGALYGFMICALKGTDPDRVVRKNNKGEKRLISFNEALKRCQDPQYINMTTHSKVLCMTHQQQCSIDVIQDHFRNAFAHYQPCLWSIELHGMPEFVIDGLEVARFLALEAGNYTHLTTEDCERVSALVADGAEFLRHGRLFREATAELP
jgi:hypothetical protein